MYCVAEHPLRHVYVLIGSMMDMAEQVLRHAEIKCLLLHNSNVW
jgi:hypothetical protein